MTMPVIEKARGKGNTKRRIKRNRIESVVIVTGRNIENGEKKEIMILMIRHTKKEGVGRNEVVVRKGDGGIEVPVVSDRIQAIAMMIQGALQMKAANAREEKEAIESQRGKIRRNTEVQANKKENF